MTDTPQETAPETTELEWNGRTLAVRRITGAQFTVLATLNERDQVGALQVVMRILKHSLGPREWADFSDRLIDPDDPLSVPDAFDLFKVIAELSNTAEDENDPRVSCPVCSQSVPIPALAAHMGTAHPGGK